MANREHVKCKKKKKKGTLYTYQIHPCSNLHPLVITVNLCNTVPTVSALLNILCILTLFLEFFNICDHVMVSNITGCSVFSSCTFTSLSFAKLLEHLTT